MSKFLGRTLNFGVGKDSPRGTLGTVAYWVPLKAYSINRKVDKAVDEAPVGSIEYSGDIAVLRKYVAGDVSVQLGVNSLGLFFYNLFGEVASATDTPESGVQTHTFNVAQTVTHQALSLFKKDGAFQVGYPLGMINTFGLSIDIGGDEHLSADINFLAKDADASTSPPNYASETVFVPRMAKVNIATDLTGLDAAADLSIKVVSLNFDKKAQADYSLASGASMEDNNNLNFEISGTLELNLTDTTYRDYVLDNSYKALRLEIEDTGTTIGAATSPRIRIDLAKVYFFDFEEVVDFQELGRQTIGFIARYSPSDNKMVRAEIINEVVSY